MTFTGYRHAILPLGVGLVVLLGACRQPDAIQVPNRVLDRPLDVALGCVMVASDGRIEGLDLDLCNTASAPRCGRPGDPELETHQLVGFVANSQRNEVGLFRRCDVNGMVDLDPDAPGYNLLPVGQVPSRIVASDLSCSVVTANVGSCDLSVIDGIGLAGYAFDIKGSQAPGSLVSTITPRLGDGQPLAARPGDLLAVPNVLSLGREDQPELDPDNELSVCAADALGSVYVTFPTCHLVAEIGLRSQRILQSRQFLTMSDGTVQVIDSGTDPVCPVECPAQFDDEVPERAAAPEGVVPTTLALVEAAEPGGSPPDDVPRYSALFVGGMGSDVVVELQFESDAQGQETGQWSQQTRSLLLEDPGGLLAIRPTPTMQFEDGTETHQFLYVVAGDGSTHVIDRDFEPNTLGRECDTQIDPTRTVESVCHAIDPGAPGPAPDRRPGAVGPGIRAPAGATINDWTFQRVPEPDPSTGGSVALGGTRSPFDRPGVVGLGVTSFGRVVYVVFDQYENAGTRVIDVDPTGVMNVEVRAHTLWPSVDPHSGLFTALPRVADQVANRTLPEEEGSAQVLAPALRQIDIAYAAPPGDGESDPERNDLVAALGNVDNADQLGRFDDSGLYEEAVPKVVARDYQRWPAQAWELVWEGEIPNAAGSAGRIECDAPGWQLGTCRPRTADQGGEIDDARLVDDTATFCDDGVLPGDKLVIGGCQTDDDCGVGQKCLRDPAAISSATGICISQLAVEQDAERMRQVCAPFISDPCGSPQREYLVTHAFQSALYLQSLDIPASSFVREQGVDGPLVEVEARLTCRLPLPAADGQPPAWTDPNGAPLTCVHDLDCQAGTGEAGTTCFGGVCLHACTSDEECSTLNGGAPNARCRQNVCRLESTCSNPDAEQCRDPDAVCTSDDHCAGSQVCIDGICRAQCEGGFPDCLACDQDAQCSHMGGGALCIDGQCRRPCEPGSPDCLLSPLPGPQCFSEFIRYAVRARNSFLVQGAQQAQFIPDRVVADPQTGECREDPTTSSLLTSRLRLGADEAATFTDPVFGIRPCLSETASPDDPNPCRITVRRSSSPTSLFHTMAYLGEDVEAIRFSNPFFSIILDLVSLTDLGSFPPDANDPWPAQWTRFRRARIPRGYRQGFVTEAGYQPLNEAVFVGIVPMTYPVRIIDAPELGAAFIVDSGGHGGAGGVRGQVIRINAAGIRAGAPLGDDSFQVR